MPAYAIAHLRTVDMNEEIVEYVRKIDATLEPYEGRFLIHGALPEVMEEPFPGALVCIEFPDIERARGWYTSDGYQEILPLRTENSDSSAIVVDGTPPGYRAASFADTVIAQMEAGS
jgi:uncharacterized protein (DUF1330 family)